MNQRRVKLPIIIGLVVIVAVVAIGVSIASKPAVNVSTAVTPTATATPAATTSPAVAQAAVTSEYKNGTYSALGTYSSPGGKQSITVNVTLAADKVTATSATSGATDSQSKAYQADFINGYKSLVVGKSLDSLNLDVVSGSSLTSTGFNAAINAIKSEAKA